MVSDQKNILVIVDVLLVATCFVLKTFYISSERMSYNVRPYCNTSIF